MKNNNIGFKIKNKWEILKEFWNYYYNFIKT